MCLLVLVLWIVGSSDTLVTLVALVYGSLWSGTLHVGNSPIAPMV